MTGEGTQPRNTQRLFHVSALEGEDYDPTIGTGASHTVRPMCDEYTGRAAGETQEDGQMQEGNGDALMTERRGYGGEVRGKGVQIVWEGGVRSGGGSDTV